MKAFPTLNGGIIVAAENESERTFLGCYRVAADNQGVKTEGGVFYSCDDPSARFIAFNLKGQKGVVNNAVQ
jgi:hypothetical protein